MNRQKWTKTDTASIMFTSLTSKNWGRTFAFSATMKADIDPAVLRTAVNDVLPHYPSVCTDLRSGFFWRYQIIADTEAEIRPAAARPLLPITARQKGLPNLRLTYAGKEVYFEAAHCIGDGRGVMRIFEEILSRYISLLAGDKSDYIPFVPPDETMENAFDTYYVKNGEKPAEAKENAFHFPEVFEKDYIKLLFAEMSKNQVISLAHSHKMTVTEYLSAALILGIIRSTDEAIAKPITISVPVDLRRFFPTKTRRNFSIESHITFHPNGRRDYTLDEICEATHGSLKAELNRENLQKYLNKYGALKNNPVVRAVPYFIKKPAMSAMQKNSHKKMTTIFTNLGERKPSAPLCDAIEKLRFINGDTSRYGLPVTCSCVSFGDTLTLCFSRANRETVWFDACVEILRSEGLTVTTEIKEGTAQCQTPKKEGKTKIGRTEALQAFFNI